MAVLLAPASLPLSGVQQFSLSMLVGNLSIELPLVDDGALLLTGRPVLVPRGLASTSLAAGLGTLLVEIAGLLPAPLPREPDLLPAVASTLPAEERGMPALLELLSQALLASLRATYCCLACTGEHDASAAKHVAPGPLLTAQ